MIIQICIVPTLAVINRFCLDNFESDSVIKKFLVVWMLLKPTLLLINF